MRAVLQRVLSARVEVDGSTVSSIGPGILVLVGLLDSDTEADAEYICRKILNTRLFPNDKTGKAWDLSVMQRNYEVLLVSQFTLYGQLKGNKLDFHVAMPPERAKPFYQSLVQRVSNAYRTDAVKDGIFGAMMQVHLVNDGPVTIQLDTQKVNGEEANQNSINDSASMIVYMKKHPVHKKGKIFGRGGQALSSNNYSRRFKATAEGFRQDAGVQAGYNVGEGGGLSKLHRFHADVSMTKIVCKSSWLQSMQTLRKNRLTIVKNPYGVSAVSLSKNWPMRHYCTMMPCKFF